MKLKACVFFMWVFFFGRTNKIDTPLVRLTEKKREKTEVTKVLNEQQNVIQTENNDDDNYYY